MTIDRMFVTLGASTVEAVGVVIVAILIVGLLVYAGFNVLAGRREVGSEMELAPNRKPYLADEELETTKLNRTLAAGLVLLTMTAVGLPLYWLHEPGRQDGAVEMFDETFINRGEARYNEGSDCAACHGPEGSGGSATYLLTDENDEFLANLTWTAPALDTAWLRFSREEIAFIIEYGRPGTPMVGWGEGGDGPLTEQQIDNLVDYILSIGISSEEAQAAVEEQLAEQLGVAVEDIDYPDPANGNPGDPQVGEALFNLDPALGGGAYACARCHTQGWSLQTDTMEAAPGREDEVAAYVEFPDGSGAFGPPLREEVPRQFATVDELADFIAGGDAVGEGYGSRGQGSGNMPAFGDNPNTEDVDDGMFSREMVCAVAVYVAGLDDEAAEADDLQAQPEDQTAEEEQPGLDTEVVGQDEPEAQPDAEAAEEDEAEEGEEVTSLDDLPFELGGYCSPDAAPEGADEAEDGEDE